MQKKYFKCYFCKIGNSHVVPIEQKGKECRCCQAYNYFYNNNNNNHSNYNQRERNNHNNNYNKNSNYNRNNNHNNKYYKKRNNRPHYQNISNTNNNIRGNQESSNNGYFSRTNTNFYHNPNVINSHNNNILHNNYNLIPYDPNLNRRINNPIFPLNNNMLFNNILNYINNNQNHISNNNVKEEKNENNNNIIKYAWLKKEKLTETIMKEKKDINDCTICLEMLKLNDDINILKCGHIFHYKCIEKVVDHHFSRCPNCRCDLKTGEKQLPKNQNIYPEPFTFSVFEISDDDVDELFDYDYDDEFY